MTFLYEVTNKSISVLPKGMSVQVVSNSPSHPSDKEMEAALLRMGVNAKDAKTYGQSIKWECKRLK